MRRRLLGFGPVGCVREEEEREAGRWGHGREGKVPRREREKKEASESGKFSFLFLIYYFSAFLFCKFNSN